MADGGQRIRVVLADEQSLFREALRVVLESEGDLEVVGEARDGLQTIAEAERTNPDVIFLDANLPNCDGLRAAVQIKERMPNCKIVVLSGTEDVRILIDALESGATGYITKDSPLVELMQTARELHRGETVIPRRMLGALLARLIRRRREQDDALKKTAQLTKREREILSLIADGHDNQAIARELVISPETARTHVQRVLTKLGVHSRLEAAAFVRRTGISNELLEAGR